MPDHDDADCDHADHDWADRDEAGRDERAQGILRPRRAVSPILPAIFIAFNIVNGIVSRSIGPFIVSTLVLAFAGVRLVRDVIAASSWCGQSCWMNSRCAKDERLLDLAGCGAGARPALMAAERLTTGRAVGVDVADPRSVRQRRRRDREKRARRRASRPASSCTPPT